MRVIFFTILIVIFSIELKSQERVTFFAEDGLQITADHYFIDESKSYVILFHQGGYSRGEYIHTAQKITKYGYNCLAVDLRSGGEVNNIQNRTALRALQKGYPTNYHSSKKDVLAAIKWVKNKNTKKIVLFGSSFSASLCLLVAQDSPIVKAVIAFSPGEFFNYNPCVKEKIKELHKPIFVASTKREQSFTKDLLSYIPQINKTLFTVSDGNGQHGSKCLWSDNKGSQEYWLALTMFFSKIRD
ncbi:MAG: dienelactone hydrolase family protein [Bacteroidota bacterium]|nr:dienelactone hydrolase family protein [Bacteroidota bacterium]